MKKTVYMIFLLLLLLIVAGCTKKKDSAYVEEINLAFNAIGQERFSEAAGHFVAAQKIEPDDKKVHFYIKQTNYIIEAKKKSYAGNTEDAVNYLNKAIKIRNGSSELVEKAQRTKEIILLM